MPLVVLASKDRQLYNRSCLCLACFVLTVFCWSAWNYLSHAGQSGEELRELTVEGTTFDPTTGGVSGLTSLDRNLEVRLLPDITAARSMNPHIVLFLLPPPPVLCPGNLFFVLMPCHLKFIWPEFAIAVMLPSLTLCADAMIPYASIAAGHYQHVS